MMNYIKGNREAWEEAFDNKKTNWGEENYKFLLSEYLPFFCTDVIKKLEAIDFGDKSVAQFCCNNGRELLSLMQLGAKEGFGFDIATNIIKQATETAEKAEIKNCQFISCNILDIEETYHEKFDFIMFTIGAITWFEDLNSLFDKVAKCLKPGGILLIHDFHPVLNMLAMPGETNFNKDNLDQIAYSYFRKEPWIENEGMSYMSEIYESKTFTSFSHTLSSIINAISIVGVHLKQFDEFDYDVGLTDVYDGKGFPLSYILIAEKNN